MPKQVDRIEAAPASQRAIEDQARAEGKQVATMIGWSSNLFRVNHEQIPDAAKTDSANVID